MIESSRRNIAVLATALMTLTGIGSVSPIAAQNFGEEVVSCVVDNGTSINLGQFESVAEAVEEAKGQDIKPDHYAIATVPPRRIAIDSAGGVHVIVEVLCTGSGRPMSKPE